ncbi:cystatin B, isoform CRA_a [Rattus norvegicus]|uniref:Cystatin B, isoform CRA_a n=1 Tax=Rattus norvegicus TaxID=10116 RepID=A6JK23_RAT|nr:cystatin B, isoform CRA_a [Rattus norvegicus]
MPKRRCILFLSKQLFSENCIKLSL